jgi:acetolactate synthase-1/2/3 large subunit
MGARVVHPGRQVCVLMGARVVHPGRQVCVLMGDGAAGFSPTDAKSLARRHPPAVIVVGGNGIRARGRHPMRAMYGYAVAADLSPGTRHDEVVRALGGAGETVTKAGDLDPAPRRASDAGVPYPVNLLTDPTDACPRSSSLA